MGDSAICSIFFIIHIQINGSVRVASGVEECIELQIVYWMVVWKNRNIYFEFWKSTDPQPISFYDEIKQYVLEVI